MKLKLALPVLGALALLAALPETAEARRRSSSFDLSVGVGSSHYGGYGRHYDSGVSFRYSRGYSRGGHGYGHRHHHHYGRSYYRDRPVYREYYHYRPVRRYVYRDYDYGYYHRPIYRRYYYRDYYDDCW